MLFHPLGGPSSRHECFQKYLERDGTLRICYHHHGDDSGLVPMTLFCLILPPLTPRGFPPHYENTRALAAGTPSPPPPPFLLSAPLLPSQPRRSLKMMLCGTLLFRSLGTRL